MSVTKGGQLYGFCPGKATWDSQTTALFNTLVVSLEYGKLFTNDDLINQASWTVDLLAWFAIVYKQELFVSRARMILGDGKEKGVKQGGNKRR